MVQKNLIAAASLLFVFSCFSACQHKTSTWRQASFSDFISGEFPDGGANIYVSARGRVELSNRWDLNKDGFVDLVLANTRDYNYVEPLFLYRLNRDCSLSKDPLALPSHEIM